MKIRGAVTWLGDDINTDVLHPSRFFSLDQLTVRDGLQGMDGPGGSVDRIIIAGRNFGYGSSRETTIQSLTLNRVRAVIATSISRIFWRNAINAGLCVVELPDPRPLNGYDELIITLPGAAISTPDGKELASGSPLDLYDLSLLESGGILPWMEKGEPLVQEPS